MKDKSSSTRRVFLCDDHVECRSQQNGFGHFFILQNDIDVVSGKDKLRCFEGKIIIFLYIIT